MDDSRSEIGSEEEAWRASQIVGSNWKYLGSQYAFKKKDGRAIWRSVEREKGSYYRPVCLSADWGSKMDQYLAYN